MILYLGVSFVNAGKGDFCKSVRLPRMCGLKPVGLWQGKPSYDPYEALGVSPNASLESIQRAYRVKARACHPDKRRLSCPAFSDTLSAADGEKEENDFGETEEPFVIINAAYEMLRKPKDRRIFDTMGSADGGRFKRRTPSAPSASDKNTKKTISDLWNLVAEGMRFAAEDNEDEEGEEADRGDTEEYELFGSEEEEGEDEEEEFSFDFSELAEIFG